MGGANSPVNRDIVKMFHVPSKTCFHFAAWRRAIVTPNLCSQNYVYFSILQCVKQRIELLSMRRKARAFFVKQI